jgi:hypothetical protein
LIVGILRKIVFRLRLNGKGRWPFSAGNRGDYGIAAYVNN